MMCSWLLESLFCALGLYIFIPIPCFLNSCFIMYLTYAYFGVKIGVFKRQSYRVGKKDLGICWFTPQIPAIARDSQGESRSQELYEPAM